MHAPFVSPQVDTRAVVQLIQTYAPAAELCAWNDVVGNAVISQGAMTHAANAMQRAPLSRDDIPGAFAKHPFVAAPMASVSGKSYRIVNECAGAGFAYSEMVSVAGLHYDSDKTWDLICPSDVEKPLVVQLFGSKPDQFRAAAARIAERLSDRLLFFDVNMACPVAKVTKKGEGSALMCTPEKAADIVRALCAETSVAVTCKIRRGYEQGNETASEFARVLEDAGAAAITVHGRYAKQLYSGNSCDACIERVARAISVPTIASGDILTPERACTLASIPGVAGVMIARGTYGNPWIFSDAYTLFSQLQQANTYDSASNGGVCADTAMPFARDADELTDMSADVSSLAPFRRSTPTRLAAMRLSVHLLAAHGSHMARARSIMSWYLAAFPHAKAWRARFMTCKSLSDFLACINELEATVCTSDAVCAINNKHVDTTVVDPSSSSSQASVFLDGSHERS